MTIGEGIPNDTLRVLVDRPIIAFDTGSDNPSRQLV